MRAEPSTTYRVGASFVHSELALPAYDMAPHARADWQVLLARSHWQRPRPRRRHGWYEPGAPRPWLWFAHDRDTYHLCFPRIVDIVISESTREMRCFPASPAGGPRLIVMVQNQALPLTLGLHDWVLHASAVSDGTGTVLFAGDAGSGKSTLASYLARQGWSLVADDAVVLREPWPAPTAIPFGGSVRLRPDSLERVLELSRRRVPRLSDRSPKRLVPLGVAGLTPAATVPPVRAVYLLDATRLAPGRKPLVRPLSAIEATLELVSATFTLKVDEPEAVRETFDRITSLVAQVPVARLSIPDDFDALPAVRELLELKN